MKAIEVMAEYEESARPKPGERDFEAALFGEGIIYSGVYVWPPVYILANRRNGRVSWIWWRVVIILRCAI